MSVRAGITAVTLTMLLVGCTGTSTRHFVEPDALYAQGLLWPQAFPELEVVIAHVPGYVLPDMAVDGIRETLDTVLQRPKAVLTIREIDLGEPTSTDRIWSWEDVRARAYTSRTTIPMGPWEGQPMRATIMVLDGVSDTAFAAGLYYGDGLIALFPDIFANQYMPIGYDRAKPPGHDILLRSLAVHELGHAMGLVNMETPMVTSRLAPDDPCECHTRNRGSVMTNGFDWVGPLRDMFTQSGQTPYRFDRDDMADLAAVRALEPQTSLGAPGTALHR